MNRIPKIVKLWNGCTIRSYALHGLGVLLVVGSTGRADIGFDHLFHQSLYKEAFNESMRLRSELERWQYLMQSEQDDNTIAELAMGKLVFLKSSVEAMVNDHIAICPEDLEYLIQIIESLEREMLTLFDKSPDSHKKIFSQLFDGIKVSINKRRDQSVV